MNKVIAFFAVAGALSLAGCGPAASCNSSGSAPVGVTALPSSCTLAPGSHATINVKVCRKCSEVAPNCVAEFRPGKTLEVDTTVTQCTDLASCPVNGCELADSTASCTVDVPADASGSYTVIPTANQSGGSQGPSSGTLTVAQGGSSSCSI